MRRLTTGIRSEKCVVRRFRRCANVIECTYTNLDSIAYYTLSLYSLLLLGYKPVQRVTVPYTVGSCNTIVLQYYNIILWDHLPIYGSSLTETSLCGAYLYSLFGMYLSSVQIIQNCSQHYVVAASTSYFISVPTCIYVDRYR